METGHVRELFPRLSYVFMGRWSSDDRLFIARGADLKGRSGIVKIDATSGEASLVVPNETCSGIPFWAPHGNSFFCYSFEEHSIIEIDITSRAVLRRYTAGGQGADVSPDGRHLVHFNDEGAPALKLLSLSDGTWRELLRLVPPGNLRGESGMWVVPVDGSSPHRLKVDVPNIGYWRFNQTTGQVAFSPSPRPRHEVWKMEHFLPATGPRR